LALLGHDSCRFEAESKIDDISKVEGTCVDRSKLNFNVR
jgi:hypothetical protein